MRTSPSQFAIILDFMERHGDVSIHTHNIKLRTKNLKKWNELVGILNSQQSEGKPKSQQKWRKAWSDFKNNTKKKRLRIKELGVGPDLTDVENRVLNLIDQQSNNNRSDLLNDELDVSVETKTGLVRHETNFPTPGFFCDIDKQPKRRKSSSSSHISSFASSEPSENRSRNERSTSKSSTSKDKNGMNEIAQRFLEFEKERDRMAHEREMARINQNDQLISIFGKIVNVLESLTPSIQRYLDRDVNQGG